MSILQIEQISVLSDNYIYILHDEDSGETAVVDPSESLPVRDFLVSKGWELTYILNTHHHHDHTGGNQDLKASYGCKVVGAKRDSVRIPGISLEVEEGDSVSIGKHTLKVLDVPGHTVGHIAFWHEDSHALFCGDALFSLGCGRLFEGTAFEMWTSLLKLRALPGDTRVFCAHEYTNSNADFALSIDPDNADLIKRAAEITKLRESGLPTIPSLLLDECRANPFLRADDADLQASLNMAGADPAKVFAEIRSRKDRF